ncbi:MAG: aspartyl/asparaginyl beta-hydroxylase domain-containing protein [Planctomycetota bacterium]
MLVRLTSVPFLLLYTWLASALFVHLRGKVRHRFLRQLTDHSTFLAPYNFWVYLFSGVRNRPVQDVGRFPELAALGRSWEAIRDEALALFDDGQLREAARRDDIAFNTFFKRGWKRFYVKWYDDVLPSALERCPRTVELVRALPGVHAAMFALLPPGSRLGAHRDPFAGSLRYHLGLVTPGDPDCAIQVDDETLVWHDGEAVMFDETFIHRAWNRTGTPRLILFCDVERPIAFPPFRWLNRFVCRHLLRATSSNNLPEERLGVVNRLAAGVHWVKEASLRLKKANRRLYYALKYALFAVVLYLLLFRDLL